MGFKTRSATSGNSSQPLAATGTGSFASIYERAVERKGVEELEQSLPTAKSAAELRRIGDDRYLAAIAKNVFRAGFVWRVIESKWPGFEEAFLGFDVDRVAGFDDADIDEIASNPAVVRNRSKIVAVRDNARFVAEVAQEHGGFGAYLADWPEDDIVGLWSELHRRGSRLGGFTRALFLREVGKDTFMLTTDVVSGLQREGAIAGAATSKRAMLAAQSAFNAWRAETGRPLCQLSRILACSVG